eukprot:TRINITY_DN30263_c0_g1_i1.p4 TRINITY_DN30263_c0_g1~~TRINITY_DN30263_c0_g1_i1.p4  ORF type:complete len:124 (+),score=15.35 TRINITY_DN30263_c0_g1_i1:524-895(+)
MLEKKKQAHMVQHQTIKSDDRQKALENQVCGQQFNKFGMREDFKGVKLQAGNQKSDNVDGDVQHQAICEEIAGGSSNQKHSSEQQTIKLNKKKKKEKQLPKRRKNETKKRELKKQTQNNLRQY